MKLQNKNAVYNILGPIILNSISFFTMPIFTRLLGPDQYGFVSVYTTWVGIFSIIFGLQVQGSIGTAYAHLGSSKIKEYLSSILLFGLLCSGLLFTIWSLCSGFIAPKMLVPLNVYYLIGIQSVCTFIITFSNIAFIFYKKAQYSFLINTSAAVLTAILSIYLILFYFPPDMAYLGKIYGTCIPYVILGTIIAVYFLKDGKFKFKGQYIKFCLPICIPLIFHALSHIILGQSDRIMLQHLSSYKTTGLYSFMIVFSGVLSSVWGALNNTWVPFYYDDLNNNSDSLIMIKTHNYLTTYSIICVVFIMWAPEVIKIFAPKSFWEALDLLPFFVLSNYFTFLYSFPVNFEFYHKKTLGIAFGTVLAACSNIVMNYFLIPQAGMLGAAVATLIAHIILFLFHEYMAEKILPYPYQYSCSTFIPFIGAVVIFVVSSVIFKNNVIFRWCIGIGLSIRFFYSIYIRKSIF